MVLVDSGRHLLITMARYPEKELMKTWGAFDTTLKLCRNAHEKTNTKRYRGLLNTLEKTYYEFDAEWRMYKEDVMKKNCKTEADFNADEEGVPLFKYNDSWSEKQFILYVDVRDTLEDCLEEQITSANIVQNAAENKSVYDADFVIDEIKTDMQNIKSSVMKLKSEIEGSADSVMTVTVCKGYENLILKQSNKLDTDLKQKVMSKLATDIESSDPDFSNANLRVKFKEFNETMKGELDSCSMLLVKKSLDISSDGKPSPDPVITTTLPSDGLLPTDGLESLSLGTRPREQVFLEKTKPPKFSGDDIEYPEFKRKWLSQVTKANLPEETELDKLRDGIPKDARDQLYGVVKLSEAWVILDKRFGDKNLIAKKLKTQLKGIQCIGKSDPEKIINLKIRVRNIVTRLETLGMEAALTHDPEFLASVYCALPDRHRVRWLDFEKENDHWKSMLSFLDKAYEQANQEMSLLSIYKDEKKKDVKAGGVSVDVVSDSRESVLKEAKKRARDSCGKCPICNIPHNWQRKDGSWWPSDRFITCRKFKDMNISQRSSTVEKSSGCPRCTSWNHQRKDCKMRPNSCGFNSGSVVCQSDHSKLLHGSSNVYCGAVHTHSSNSEIFEHVRENEEAIFFVQDIPARNTKVKPRVMWDKGCNRVLIRDSFAKKSNLVSKEVVYTMEVVGDSKPKQIKSRIYLLDLIDMYGNIHSIWGYGTPKIMTSSIPDLSVIRHLFPHVPADAFMSLPSKEVDVLIGLNMNELQPAGGLGTDRVKGLSALRSLFGCGWVVGGHHDDIRNTYSDISSAAAILKVAKILIEPKPPITPEFWESEGLGVFPPPRCDHCKNCMERGPCSEKHFQHSIKKQAELDLIKSKTHLHEGEVWCEYPYIRDPACLSFNRDAVIKVAEKVEKSLIKDNVREAFNEQIRDQLRRGVAVKLSDDELQSWVGPCQYITTHAVFKDSVTTPVRVVSNSSFNNGGKSLNSCLASGPNSLNSMLDVMLRFRSYPVAVQFDMAKAYNTLRTGPVERHLRRFVWRFTTNEPWQDFALDRVHFGDTCAATQLEVAKNVIAKAGAHIDPEASSRIMNDVYVDDCLSGGTLEQVYRYVGNKMSDGSYDGTFSKILALGNFKIKAFAISGQTPNEESDLLGDKVLGYGYDLAKDNLSVKFPLNISPKKRSVRVEANLTLNDLDKLKSETLTKRILLGVVNSFGDFLGFAAPFTIRYKKLMRNLFLLDKPLSWDESIPESCYESWLNLLQETLESGDLVFPRCVRPSSAVPDRGPELIGCSDYGMDGYDARVYLRWELDNSSTAFEARLAICKVRVPPLSGLTVPRGELSSLTLQSRLMLTVVRALQKLEYPPVSGIMLVDSRCAISSLYSTKMLLPYFQNRVSEIRDNIAQFKKLCQMEDVHHVESCLNPSDISTRATARISELGPSSLHQVGPNFFSLPRRDWPVTSDYSVDDIPITEYKARDKLVFSAATRFNFCHSGLYPNNPWGVIESLLHYSDSLQKIKRIVSRYMRGLSSELRKSGKLVKDNPQAYELISMEPSRLELKKAEHLLLLHGMPHTKDAIDAGKLDSLLPVREHGIIVTRGRLGESLEKLLGVESLPILMPESRIAYLYMIYAHSGEFGLVHRSSVATLARSRRYVWIVRGRNLAKRIANNCPQCIRNRKELLMQQMGDIREESLSVSPPWRNVSLDFAGPLTVRGEVNRRARMKVWILIYTCRATKSVCLLATPGYSTSDFLCKHNEFIYRKGRPDSVVSDRGSQLVAAGIVIANKDLPVNKLDWQKVTSVNAATDWQFVPVGGQHRNGLSEATVKILKKSLSLAIHPSVGLTYSELVTLLAKITFSINSRPLAVGYISPNSQQEDCLIPLTPNHLLLGRASLDAPDLRFDESNKFSARLSYIQEVFKAWWNRWIVDVLPTLVPCRRWKNIRKNLNRGDIVMMHYSGNLTDDYRIAKVVDVYKDKKGLIRTVKVCFRKRDRREPAGEYWKKPLTSEIVAVQRLSLLQAVGEPLPSGGAEDQLPLDINVRAQAIKASLAVVTA